MSERALIRSAEASLVLVTLAAVLGMHRLFASGEWAGPLLANAVAAHVVATALRRRGFSLSASAAIMVVAAALVATWTSYWSTTALGIPTGDTWTAMRTDLDSAWSLYQDVVAPAEVQTGFVLASSLAIWCIAYVADWAAFRLWVPFESTLPAGTLFLFTALLGEERGRAWGVAMYAGSLLLFLLLHRLARQEGSSHWVAERRAAGNRSLLVAGGGLAAIAVLVGTLIGPNLPFADAAGLFDPRDLNGNDEPRVTVSPLVDIRSRLVDQSNVEVFTVRSSARAYWRLTSLERFDGRIWSSSGSYGKADEDLPEAVDTDITTEAVQQRFSIEALAAIWLPSAYEPRAFRGDDVEVRYDEDSGTLIVDSSEETSDGLQYEVTSQSPRIVPDDLRAGADEVPEGIRERFSGLPSEFSARVRQLAVDLTAGASGPYEQARALQDHLRGFTYDLEVQAGHSGDVLETFLFDTQRGYCEQFAGAFAAMARAVGLPARVAVGFTPGEVDPNDPEVFHVLGEHAHAWPEVFIAGAGWVAFEPTPGRGMPAAEPYTGVPEQQAAPGRPTEVQVIPVQPTTDPNQQNGQGTSTTVATDGGTDAGTDQGDDGQGQEDDPLEDYVVDPAKRALPIVLAIVALYLVGVPLALLAHRRRRRSRATTASQRVAVAWMEAAEDAALVGYRDRPSDTYAERADRLGDVLPPATAPARTLARSGEAADYSAGGADGDEVDAAVAAAATIAAEVRAVAGKGAQIARWLDPRPPVRAWRRERAGRQRRITTLVSTPSEDTADTDGELVGASTPD